MSEESLMPIPKIQLTEAQREKLREAWAEYGGVTITAEQCDVLAGQTAALIESIPSLSLLAEQIVKGTG